MASRQRIHIQGAWYSKYSKIKKYKVQKYKNTQVQNTKIQGAELATSAEMQVSGGIRDQGTVYRHYNNASQLMFRKSDFSQIFK